MTRYRVLSWRDVPLTIKVRGDDGRTISTELDRWYTEHADRIAMADGILNSDEYLEAYIWSDWTERDGAAADVAAEVMEEIDAAWAPTRESWTQTGSLGR